MWVPAFIKKRLTNNAIVVKMLVDGVFHLGVTTNTNIDWLKSKNVIVEHLYLDINYIHVQLFQTDVFDPTEVSLDLRSFVYDHRDQISNTEICNLTNLVKAKFPNMKSFDIYKYGKYYWY